MVSLTSVHIQQRAQLTRLESNLLQYGWALILKLSYRPRAHARPAQHWCVSQDKNIQEHEFMNTRASVQPI